MGGALEVIQHKPKVQTVYQGVSADSKWVYYRANDVQPDSYALYRFNIESRASERIFDQAGIWSIADHRDDRTFLLEKATGSLSSEFFEFDLASKTLTPLLGQNEKEEYQVQFSSQKGELLVLSNKMGDFKRLYRWKAGTFTPVTPDVKMDVSGFTIDHAHRRIYTMTNDQGYSRTQVFDAHTYRTVPLPSLPKDVYHITVASLTRNGRFAVFGVETVKAPKTSYVWDWNSKKLTQWVVPGAPEIDTSKFVQSVLESYPARDGTPIPMFVRRSEKCKAAATPCPVLVHFHGGPEGQSVPYFSAVMQAVVDQGYILVEPNVRGSDGYGRKYIESDNGPKRLDVISDIEDCSKFIRSSWAKGGKTPKIGIFGWSYGGYSTFFAMTRFAGAYDAGVAMVGMSNLYTFLMNTAPYRRILRISEYGDPEKDKEALKKLSPITYLDQVRSPLLITQGVNDPRVPAGEAIQIQEALTRKKIPSQLILFGDEGHGATKRENRVLELGNLIQFFNKHLQ
jgi:dipeptidyl aminopeptidase/acylaminoacyl peptidase